MEHPYSGFATITDYTTPAGFSLAPGGSIAFPYLWLLLSPVEIALRTSISRRLTLPLFKDVLKDEQPPICSSLTFYLLKMINTLVYIKSLAQR
jgi:hypothetical protein